MDEFTREDHALEVDYGIIGENVVDTLAYLLQVHSEPEFIWSGRAVQGVP